MKHQPQYIQRGFTLIELLIVVGIIAILSAIGIPKMWNAYNLAKDKQVITEMRNMAVAIGLYRVDFEMVPQGNITDMIEALKNSRTGGEGITMDEYDAWGGRFYYKNVDFDAYTLISRGKGGQLGAPATDKYFDPTADIVLITGVFRASHQGTTIVVGQ